MNPTDMAVPSADNDVLGDDYYGPDGLPDERRRVRNRQKSVTYRENKKVELKHLKVEATELFMKCSKTFAIAKAYLDIGSDERKGTVQLHLATLSPQEQSYLSAAFRSPYVKPPPRPDTSRGRTALDNLADSGKSRSEIMRERNRLNSFHYRQEKKKEFQAWQDEYDLLLLLARKMAALEDILVNHLNGKPHINPLSTATTTSDATMAALQSTHTMSVSSAPLLLAPAGQFPRQFAERPNESTANATQSVPQPASTARFYGGTPAGSTARFYGGTPAGSTARHMQDTSQLGNDVTGTQDGDGNEGCTSTDSPVGSTERRPSSLEDIQKVQPPTLKPAAANPTTVEAEQPVPKRNKVTEVDN